MNPSDVIAQRNLMPSEAPRIWIPLGILLTLLFLAPALGLKGFMQALVIEILIFSLLALSLNVLVGYVGLVSFGHAAFLPLQAMPSALLAAHGRLKSLCLYHCQSSARRYAQYLLGCYLSAYQDFIS